MAAKRRPVVREFPNEVYAVWEPDDTDHEKGGYWLFWENLEDIEKDYADRVGLYFLDSIGKVTASERKFVKK